MSYQHSPHLAQWALHDRLVRVLHATIRMLPDAGLPLRVLEIGAGHGGYTGAALAAGCEVTAVDMSRASQQILESRYGTNERLTALFDPGALLSEVGDGYSLALCISVLHHIPDYMAFLGRITDRLLPGGAILMLQEPLWYPRVGRLKHTIDRAAYLAWRVGQGNFRQGVAAMSRRLRGAYPETTVDEIVYYHVVRRGVDEEAVARFLEDRFTQVEMLAYWSNHLGAIRRAAEVAGIANTFGVRSTGYTG